MSTTETQTPRFIVMDASAHMPRSCWGRYRRVAVVEVDPAKLPAGALAPAMISERARGCVRIVETWERCNVGKTKRCAYEQALEAAEALAAELNAKS